MAENIDVNVNVNTSQANRNLDNLNTRIGTLQRSFSALKTVLGGVAFGSLISNSLRFADSIQDISNATGIATGNVLAFGQAVQQNGGSFESAQNALTKLVGTIGEAAEGSGTAQNAFAKVGVTLNDLRNLSEQQIFEKSIQGLAKLNDRALQAKISTELFGKAIRGVDIARLAASYEEASRNAAKYSNAITTGAQVQQNLETAITNLQTALLVVLKPIGDLAKNITTNVDAMVRWISAIGELVITLGGLFLIGRLAALIYDGVRAIRAMYVAIKEARSQIKWLSEGLGVTFKNLRAVIDKIKELGGTNVIAKTVGEKLAFIFNTASKLAIGAAAAAASWLGLTRAWEKFNEVAEQQKIDEIVDYIDDLNEKSTEAWMAAQQEAEARRQVEDANKKLANSILEVRQAYNKNREEIENAMETEVAFAMMATETADQIRAQQEAYTKIIDAIDDLRKKKQDLGSENKEQIALIDREIAALYAQIPAATEAARVRVEMLQQVKAAQDELNKSIEIEKMDLESQASLQNLQEQLALIGQYGEELSRNEMVLNVTNELQNKLVEYQKQLLDLQKQKTQLTDEQYASELNHINTMITKAYEYADARLEAEQQILNAQKAVQENAKLGTEQAMADIAKQFKPYNMAQEAVQKSWGKIGDAIDTFVETGKLKFSDLARSVLADLAKMIAKAMIFKAISGIASAFGLSIPGLATGGQAKAGQPYIVGERGPELFVPQGSGTVVPNNQLGNRGVASGAVNAPVTNNYITNNISAIDAKGVAQLFAENRKTLLGSVKMAEREMPYMAR